VAAAERHGMPRPSSANIVAEAVPFWSPQDLMIVEAMRASNEAKNAGGGSCTRAG